MRLLLVTALLPGAIACGAPAAAPLTLSVVAVDPAAAADGSNPPAAMPVGPAVTIERLRLVVGRVILEPAPEAGFVHPATHQVLVGPFVVELGPADLGVLTPFASVSHAEGGFAATVIEVRPLRSDEAAGAVDGTSVRVEGRRGGVPFSFEARDRFEVRHVAPFKLDASGGNLTLRMDVRRWFSDGTGTALDPADPEAHHDAVASIQASMLPFDDPSRSGAHPVAAGEPEHDVMLGPVTPVAPEDGAPVSPGEHQH